MEVLILLVFVSTMLAAGFVGFFVWNVRQGTNEHSDRLALMPLADDDAPSGTSRANARPDDDDAQAPRTPADSSSSKTQRGPTEP